jgi:hypothetical protein
MPIDDELEKSTLATEIRVESEKTIQDLLVKSGIAGSISLLPFGVGAAINEMLTQLALRRVHERMTAMLDEMGRRIRELGEQKIDRGWFCGEGFQSLMFEALHQLHVTDDRTRIRMLGNGLANSGSTEFTQETRKHLFMQLVRDLTPQHINLLQRLLPREKPGQVTDEQYTDLVRWESRPHVQGRGTDLLILQMLAANGLVEEHLVSTPVREPAVGRTPSMTEIENALKKFIRELQKPPLRYFRLSDLGMGFLNFVGSDQKEKATPG